MKDLLEELKLAADLAEVHEMPEEGMLYIRAIGEIRKLRDALADANGMCRSAYHIAERDGSGTAWDTFRARLMESLKRQHAVMYPKVTPNVQAHLTDKSAAFGRSGGA